MSVAVELDSKEAMKYLRAKAGAIIDPSPILKRVAIMVMSRILRMFDAMRRGGTRRGVTWDDFKDQYTRATDGATVPAHGGVPRLDGKGLVLGRLRPSGKRLTESSSLMQDTGALKAAIGVSGRRAITRNKNEIRITPSGVPYAGFQHAMRSFMFWELPKDLDDAVKIAVNYIDKQVR